MRMRWPQKLDFRIVAAAARQEKGTILGRRFASNQFHEAEKPPNYQGLSE